MLWLSLAVLALLAAVLFLPIHVRMSLQSDPVRQATVQVRPFGGVCPPIAVFDSRRKAKSKRKPKKKPPKARGRGGLRARGDVLAEVSRLVRRLIGAVHIEDVRADAEFGLGDPAETGQLYGQLTPLIHMTGGHLQVRPNFAVACLRGSGLAQFRLTLIGLIWPFVGFGWRVFGPFR